MRALDEVAARLPFHVGDVEAANAAFQRWRETGEDRDLETVELWLYCYTRRYFLVKFLRDTSHGAADLDQLVAKAFGKARGRLDSVEQPERFASWVSVICKHTFINFLRRYRGQTVLDAERLPDAAPDPAYEHDRLAARRAVERAIARLPDALQEVARLRFLEDRSYEQIHEATGRPVPSLRAYVNKAVTRFRKDPDLVALYEEMQT